MLFRSPLPPGLIDVATRLPVRVELKYATKDNFMKRDVYGSWTRCVLVEDAVHILEAAHAALVARNPALTFVLYDCARPRSVQMQMWDVVKGTPQQGYVADPTRPPGSVHNRGCAVDLTLYDLKTGQAVEMPSGYDEFSDRAYADYPGGTSRQRWLRDLLRKAMESEGFAVYEEEWWHFDYKDWSKYRIGTQTFEELGK